MSRTHSLLKRLFGSYERSIGGATGPLKPFTDIPGPRALPVIGSTWKYILPLPDRYDPERLHRAAARKYDQYGPLVRETLPGGAGLVSVFDPEDIKSFLMQTAEEPDRRSHLALNKYRTDRPHMYSSGGLLPSNGPEWRRLRRASQGIFGRREAVQGRQADVDQVVRDFVQLLRDIRGPEARVPDMMKSIKMMNLEVLCAVLLDERLGCVVPRPPPHCEALMQAGGRSTQAILKTDNGPLQLYRWCNTPLYKQLVHSQDLIYKVAKRQYDRKKGELTEHADAGGGGVASILERLIRSPVLGERDVVGLVCDALMAGVDTTSYSLAFCLHHLATNQRAQGQMALEAGALMMGTGGRVTSEVVSQARYTAAVVKESLRLSPISIGIGRVNTHNPIVVRGYSIPAGTTIVSMNQHICRNPRYFDDPNSFRPERFLGGENKAHSHAMLPFGQGSRMCIAQSIARQTLMTSLLQLSYNFCMEWQGSALDCRVQLINEPDGPICMSLTDRQDNKTT